MPKKTRVHIDEMPEGDMTPKYLTKQQFGRRLYQLMMERGWNQSELARQANLPRDSVSVYIRGKSLPTPKSLQKLSLALGVSMGDLLPNMIGEAIDEDIPSVEMRVSTSAPDQAWLRINRLVPFKTAVRIVEMLKDDAPANAS